MIPINAYAADKYNTISKDELTNRYGTVAKIKNVSKRSEPYLRSDKNRLSPHFEKGSFAYLMGNDSAKSGDYESALKHWKLSSIEGNFYADWKLAQLFLGKFSSQKDDIKAIKYLRLVISQYKLSSNSRTRLQITSDAMVELAIFYTNGSQQAKLQPNIPNVIKLLNIASSSVGHAQANYLLGEIYFNNKHVRPQKKRAIRYYTLAARKNNLESQLKLGQIYYLNGSNPKAQTQGLAWLLIAKKNSQPSITTIVDNIIASNIKLSSSKQLLVNAKQIAKRIALKWNF